jgi:TfuA protein
VLNIRKSPIVFAGASLSNLSPVHKRRLSLRHPVRRGDLIKLVESESPGTIVLIDGLFNSTLAVTPAECRETLKAGWRLIGASSMGALRASELWPAGMIGIGHIFTLFRLGILRSDADVAVALHPQTFEEATASTVHIRAILFHLEVHRKLSKSLARRLLLIARGIHWYDRDWDTVFRLWRKAGIDSDMLIAASDCAKNPLLHPKKLDAQLAINSLLAYRWVQHF